MEEVTGLALATENMSVIRILFRHESGSYFLKCGHCQGQNELNPTLGQ